MSDKYDVGYGKPPKEHQFKKNQSGNPGGRRKKEKKRNDAAVLMKEIAEETITLGGKEYTKDEALLQVLFAKALKGDMSAMRLYMTMKEKLGLMRSIESLEKRGGVLVVPAPMSFDEWGVQAAAHQAKFRGEDPEGLARLMDEAPGGKHNSH